jgi:hypothetical protein
MGRSSAQWAFQPAELKRGYQALSVDIFRKTRNAEQSALHLTQRPGRAESGETTKNLPSRWACWNMGFSKLDIRYILKEGKRI